MPIVTVKSGSSGQSHTRDAAKQPVGSNVTSAPVDDATVKKPTLSAPDSDTTIMTRELAVDRKTGNSMDDGKIIRPPPEPVSETSVKESDAELDSCLNTGTSEPWPREDDSCRRSSIALFLQASDEQEGRGALEVPAGENGAVAATRG